MVKRKTVAKTEMDIVFIGAKEVDKTSLIFKMKKTLKNSLQCHEVLLKEYCAERKDDVLLITSPHEDGFITGNGSTLGHKGDIFVVMFKASRDSQSFIEAAMLLELLLPLQKHRVILLGDSSGVPPEKEVECEEDMNRKTKSQMGVRYIEVSNEDSEDEDEEHTKQAKPIAKTVQLPMPPAFRVSDLASAPKPKQTVCAEPTRRDYRLGTSTAKIKRVYSPKALFTSTPVKHQTREGRDVSDGYQVGVIRRLDMILENQKEHLSLMRQLLSSTRGPVSEDLEDVLPSPLTSQADLEELSTRLGHDSEFKKKMTCYLASLGGATVGDCARRIMRRLGTNELWSGYSLKGRKGKKALREMQVLRVIFKACLSSCKQTTVAEVEEVVRDFLKQAPHKRGGLKFKNPTQTRMDLDNTL